MELDFDIIWQKYIMPLKGCTLEGYRGQKNTILNVDRNGLCRLSKNNLQSTISIEVFEWTVKELFRRGRITRDEIHSRFFPQRVSSCVVLVLSQVEFFKLKTEPLTLVYTGGCPEECSLKVSARTMPEGKVTCSIKEAESQLMDGPFVPVIDLPEKKNLNVRGVYCIRLRAGVALPAGYKCVNRILYVGVAKHSLLQRLWNQELHAVGHGTFFRSVGAMLGFRPAAGSLVGKKNSKNYRFSPSDEKEVIKWLERSTLVNCIELNGELKGIESDLIRKYSPLLNIQGNPNASELLKRDREECRKIAMKNERV